ncbi:prepilin peptidase [Jannaschia aquimarina]|uniref:OutO protein n=1 Tax=Jannaschia aquimarina TaxID=935700 RepID=A0A0D1EJ88_9RHOB|nr:A24 family peptidase [Jannaschia aquimarina]KIT15860.1 Type 4 prepilin-like proteins leader peptide-processing enzyme [Jannaschia aquimarina]SNT10232.1 Type IV leader peptidase family protein [Jannaschia aquimarina]
MDAAQTLIALAVVAVAFWLGPTRIAVRAVTCFFGGRPAMVRWQGPAHLGLIAGGLSAIAMAGHLSGGHGALQAALLVLLLILAVIDLKWHWLPMEWTVPVLFISLISALFAADLAPSVIGAFLGGGALWLLQTLFRAVRGIEGLGTGDVVLMAGIGAAVGADAISWVLALASGTGLLHWLWLSLHGSNTASRPIAVAFGAHLCAVTPFLLS